MLRFYNLREFDDERAAKEVDSSTVVAFLYHHLDNSPALIADCLNPTHLKPLINSGDGRRFAGREGEFWVPAAFAGGTIAVERHGGGVGEDA